MKAAHLHGEATLGDIAAFGCDDGVLLVHTRHGEMMATKLENPVGAPEEVRVDTLMAHKAAGVFVGNFGEVWIDPKAKAMETVDTGTPPLRFAFDHEGEHVLALTEPGLLHRPEAATGDLDGTLRVMQALDTSGGDRSYVSPNLAVIENTLYISLLTEGQKCRDLPGRDERRPQVRPTRNPEQPCGIGSKRYRSLMPRPSH